MEEQKSKKTTSREYYLFAFRILGDFGATIAIPVVLFVLIGHYLDAKYAKTPLFTILGFILAAYITIRIIKRKAVAYGAEYKRMNDAGKPEDGSKNI